MKYTPGVVPASPENLGRYADAEFRKLQNALLHMADVRVGSVSIANATTTTTITDEHVRPTAVITLMPTSAAGAAFLANIYQSTTANGSLVLAHTNPGATLVFNYVIHIPLNTITR